MFAILGPDVNFITFPDFPVFLVTSLIKMRQVFNQAWINTHPHTWCVAESSCLSCFCCDRSPLTKAA